MSESESIGVYTTEGLGEAEKFLLNANDQTMRNY